ncbi:acyl-CoA N-acyltransferase [Mycena floridula]|nr:acyl-CoA N-acyltransferase [Mycena floridula]
MSSHSHILKSSNGRIELVPPSAAEDEAVAHLRSRPETLRYLPILPERCTVDDARQLREKRAQLASYLPFHIHVGDQFGGMGDLHFIDKENNSCHVGIIVSPDMHGQNLGTEAIYLLLEFVFESQGYHRATFETGADNVHMRGWLEKTAGIRLEGMMKDAWKRDSGNVYYDMASYGILEGEWRDGIKEKLRARLNRR